MNIENNTISYESLSLEGERIVLIGGAGFIGHNLALALRDKNAEVMVYDNLQINNLVNIVSNPLLEDVRRKLYINFLLQRFEMMLNAGVVIENGDGRNMVELANAFSSFQPTKVVNLAAISSAVKANQCPGLAWDLEINSLRNIIELSRMSESKVNQVMIMSSSTVYGDFEEESVDETIRPQPRGVYANGKYMAERMIREACILYDIDYTIIRPSALYGERCISGRVSQKFVEDALLKKPLLLEGGGGGRLDFTYIEDLVDGMIRALCFVGGLSRTFNITFGNARKITELAAIIKEYIPDVILEERPAVIEKPKRGTLMIDRAKEYLNFVPKNSLDIGYRKYVEWYINQWEKITKG